MFESGITASILIADIKTETDIALDLGDSTYLSFLNETEQLLYSEIIKEQAAITLSDIYETSITLSTITGRPANTDPIRFSDIYTVFAQSEGGYMEQLIKTNLASSDNIFHGCYWEDNGDICLSELHPVVRIVYFVRPKIKDLTNYSSETVKLPPEFISLIKAKMRAEAYKLANEDVLAAKWINDYNVLLEDFRMWIEQRRAQFGM